MSKKLSNKEWRGFIDDYYNNYINSKTINEFCRENDISNQQFHYHKKRIKDARNSDNTLFQSIILDSKEHRISDSKVKISIGNATISIPISETTLISTIIKELVRC